MTQVQDLQLAQLQSGRHGAWWRVLLTGVLFYFIGLVVLVLTGNPVLYGAGGLRGLLL